MKRKERLGAFVLALSVLAGTELGYSSDRNGAGYVLKECDGVITVFSGETSASTGISTCHLPRIDREKLRNGIEIVTREELLALLEDLGS